MRKSVKNAGGIALLWTLFGVGMACLYIVCHVVFH